MELSEDEIIEKYGKEFGRCSRNILLPYENECTCISCEYNVIKRKQELSKNQQKKINFINGLKYAEHKIFCIYIEVYKIHESIHYDKLYEVLTNLKNKKLKTNNNFIKKYKDMLENPDFEQNYYSRTAIGFYKIGHDSIRLMRWFAYYDRSYYEKKYYYELM